MGDMDIHTQAACALCLFADLSHSISSLKWISSLQEKSKGKQNSLMLYLVKKGEKKEDSWKNKCRVQNVSQLGQMSCFPIV